MNKSVADSCSRCLKQHKRQLKYVAIGWALQTSWKSSNVQSFVNSSYLLSTAYDKITIILY